MYLAPKGINNSTISNNVFICIDGRVIDLKKLSALIVFVTFIFTGYDVGVSAKEHKEKFNEIFDRETPQTFQFTFDYEELYEFLNITEKEFKAKWDSGKTVTEIAEEREIYPQQLILYLSEKQFKALDKALNEGEIDRYYYYDYAMSYMKGDIIEFINRNPNKQET